MNQKKTGLVRLDPTLVEKSSLRMGLPLLELFKKAGIGEKTGYRMARGEACRVSNALQLAKALGVDDLNELVLNNEDAAVVTSKDSGGLPTEWELEDSLSPWITATNGLQYRVYRLQHRHLPDEAARAKCFDLDNMACEQAGEMRNVLLVRHAQVCRALASSLFLPTNQSVDITEKQCWVIDSWPRGESLTTHVTAGAIPQATIPAIMLSLAAVLSELHTHEIVLRDLHPDTVYYELEAGQLTLVDLELAKLLDGSPTVVHGELTENPFRAPECVSPKIDHTADIFSWAQMMSFLVTGRMPATGDEQPDELGLPPRLSKLWQACLADSYRERPQSFDKIIPAVKRWKP